MACACAGIVIGCVTITGLGIVFTQIVIALAQNSLVLALVLTAMAGIVLGMGMPTTPAYIVMVSLLVPAIIKLGAITPAAHMFAFYFAILSAITPPVALAVFAAASLAKANMWKIGLGGDARAAPAYIVPFMFVYEPSLLLIGDVFTSLTSALSATVGVICLAAGLHGYLLRECRWWERIALLAAALLLIKPGYVTDAIGLGLLALVLVVQKAVRAPRAQTPVGARSARLAAAARAGGADAARRRLAVRLRRSARCRLAARIRGAAAGPPGRCRETLDDARSAPRCARNTCLAVRAAGRRSLSADRSGRRSSTRADAGLSAE